MQTIHVTDLNLQHKVLLIVYLKEMKTTRRNAGAGEPAVAKLENPGDVLHFQFSGSDIKKRANNGSHHVLQEPAAFNSENPFV
jgi:hypothetical protein